MMYVITWCRSCTMMCTCTSHSCLGYFQFLSAALWLNDWNSCLSPVKNTLTIMYFKKTLRSFLKRLLSNSSASMPMLLSARKLYIMQKMDTLFLLIQIAIWCGEVERIRHICSLQPLPKLPKFQIPPLWLHWYYKDLIPRVGQSSLTLAIIFSRWVNYGTYAIQVKI